MSANLEQQKLRPYSADVARLTKVRLQSSNCPTILKHEVINNSPEAFQPFNNPGTSERQVLIDRPRTASNATKMKFTFLQGSRTMASPVSGGSFRPVSGMNSTINFDFLNGMGKAPQGKFKDKSRIKPIKKLNTEQFHNVIYKVKHQKELLEKEINRMEQWHKDFKENEIWSTPQTAIIDSILRMNAKSNPDGNVGRYLQTEKEKEEDLKLSKKYQRPASSAGFLARRTPNNAKSVKDFFVAQDDGEEVIEEILTSNKVYYKNYNNNKLKISERIQSYVSNMDNYNSLMSSTQGLVLRDEDTRGTVPKAYKHLERSLKESKEASAYSATFGEQGRSISEMVESCEGSEVSYSGNNLQTRVKSSFNQTMQAKNRPMSATVNTAFSPKNFGTTVSGAESATNKPYMSQKGPSLMHARPQTAKATRMPPSITLGNSASAMGEFKQPSITNVKFIPIVMEGQKINVDAYNRTLNKSRENAIAVASRKFQYQDEDDLTSSVASDNKGYTSTKNGQTALINSSFKSISMLKEESDKTSQQGVSKFAHKRLMSAKANMRASGTQTQTQSQPQEINPSTVGKVNIDGEYFQTYSSTNSNTRNQTRPFRTVKQSRKDILESWTTKENQPMAQYAQEAEIY